jgi:murein DD-endopeptidase MepM/ murein hydrolase activator NlpD
MRVLPTVALSLALMTMAGCGARPRAVRPAPPEAGARPSGPFSSPLATYTVLSRFGPRDGRFHTGLDIRGKRGGGDPVRAARAGRVTRAQVMSGYGKMVEIRHVDGFSTRYAHLSRYVVRKDQKVKAGELLGLVGSTGRATTAHLHFEILTPAYRFIDPEPLLRPRSSAKKG